jgi:hypothetical protein
MDSKNGGSENVRRVSSKRVSLGGMIALTVLLVRAKKFSVSRTVPRKELTLNLLTVHAKECECI